MPFEITGPAVLKAINLRTEGGDDTRHAAFDLKLQCVVVSDTVAELMGADDSYHFRHLFWREDSERNLRFFNLSPLRLEDTEIQNIRVRLLTGIRIDNCVARAFKFTPLAGGYAELNFTLRCSYPPPGAASLLHERLSEQLDIELTTVQQELFDEASPRLKHSAQSDPLKPEQPPSDRYKPDSTPQDAQSDYQRAVAHVREHGCSLINLAHALDVGLETAQHLIGQMLEHNIIKAEHNMYIVLKTKPRAEQLAKVAP